MVLVRTELHSPTSRLEKRLTEVRQGHMVLGLGWEPDSYRHGAHHCASGAVLCSRYEPW